MWRLCVAVTVPVLTVCTRESVDIPEVVQVDGVTVLVSTASEALSRPADVTLDDVGNIYVVDRLRAQILVFSPSGALLETIGREGSGPHEFRSPRSLAVTQDTMRVVDVGNGVLHTLARDSDFEDRTPLPLGTGMSPIAVSSDGRLLAGTLGAQGTLAVLQDPSGNEAEKLGEVEAPATMTLDLIQMKRDLIEGKLPAIAQNAALPAFAPNGDLWLVLTGRGIVQRYGSGGALLLAVPFETPEKDAIWAACIDRNKETLNDPRRICLPRYATDAVDDGEKLWVLLNMPEDETSVMLGFASSGALVQRIRFRSVTGARQFALDRERGRIVFAIPSTASVVATTFPVGL